MCDVCNNNQNIFLMKVRQINNTIDMSICRSNVVILSLRSTKQKTQQKIDFQTLHAHVGIIPGNIEIFILHFYFFFNFTRDVYLNSGIGNRARRSHASLSPETTPVRRKNLYDLRQIVHQLVITCVTDEL